MGSILGRIFGAFSGGGGAAEAPQAEPQEYKGYTIVAAPRSDAGQWLTAGTIRREVDGEMLTHDFIRADRHPDLDTAVTHSERKARQIIDEQGDGLFRRS